jgi:hypothetical protein
MVLMEPGIGGVADDSEHPGASIAADEATDAAEGAERCILHHIFGVRATARQPVRQIVGRIEMRHHHTGEERVVIEAADRVSDVNGCSSIADVMGELRGAWRQCCRIRCDDCETRHVRRPLRTL